MLAGFYHDGHIGWLLFAAVVYTGVCILAADYAWRRLTMSGARLAVLVLMGWAIGLGVIIAAVPGP